jgi:hypothetical protein
MPIRRYLENGAVFTPETHTAMSQAHTETAENHGIGNDENKRQAVARFIIRVAGEDGSLNAKTLRDRALTAFGGLAYRRHSRQALSR